jgi:hypothetical protein
MNGQVFWDNDEHTILRQIYNENVQVNDIVEIATKTYETLLTVPHKVHLIIEMPPFTRSIRQSWLEASQKLNRTVAPNQGIVVSIIKGGGSDLLVKSIGVAAPKAAKNVFEAKSVEEARQLIAEKTQAKS